MFRYKAKITFLTKIRIINTTEKSKPPLSRNVVQQFGCAEEGVDGEKACACYLALLRNRQKECNSRNLVNDGIYLSVTAVETVYRIDICPKENLPYYWICPITGHPTVYTVTIGPK